MNRPRAVDFLDEDEKEVEKRNFSEEEPLVIERCDSGSDVEELNLSGVEGETEIVQDQDVKNVKTLPSGAISKGKKD